MRIGVTTTPDTTAVVLVIDDAGQALGYDLTRDEAVAVRDALTGAINTVDRAADPHHGKTLRIGVRGDATVAEVTEWRKRLIADFGSPIYHYAYYVLEDMREQIASSDIAEILAWAEANPGHPFTLTLVDDVVDPADVP